MNKLEAEKKEWVMAPQVERMLKRQQTQQFAEYQTKSAVERRILNAGWEPCNLPKNGYLGEVRPVAWSGLVAEGLFAIFAFVITIGTMSFLAGLFLRWGNEGVGAGFIVFSILLLMTAGHFVAAALNSWQILSALRRRPLPTTLPRPVYDGFYPPPERPSYRLYTGAMPRQAWDKYRQALRKHLFDAVVIWGADESQFTVVEVQPLGLVHLPPAISPALGCPMLIGSKDGRLYRGWKWDLDKDMAAWTKKVRREI
mgnify:CR=1 FL=1